MTDKKPLDAVIFDLDGTLWDSGEAVAISWTEAATRYFNKETVFTADDVHSVMGMTMDKISRRFFGDLPDDERTEVTKYCFDHEVEYLCEHGGVLFSGLEDTLKEVRKRCPIYIVSNCQEGYIEAFLEYHKLGYLFSDYEDYGRTGLEKAGSIRVLLERNGIENPVYVGDTLGDFEACVKAGVDFIHAAYGFGIVDNVPKLNDIRDLPRLLSELYK